MFWINKNKKQPFIIIYNFLTSVFFFLLIKKKTVSLRELMNLVDSASSHMLVSKIKPCMCKYKQLVLVKLRMAH